MLLDYDNPATWPAEAIKLLDENLVVLDDWVTDQRFVTGHQYDRVIRQLAEVLRPHDILGWHSTRLTPREAADILANGMFLPSVEKLMMRIEAAEREGMFSPAIAESFMRRHQADSPTRSGRIWFLFTRPHNDDGVEDFFRFWGGESLYAAIDRDPDLGPVLRSVGVPSVVDAAIPISYFQDSLGYESHIARQFCAWRASRPYNGVPHDRALAAIPSECIRRIATFHDPDFASLTGCDAYFEPLMSPSATPIEGHQ